MSVERTGLSTVPITIPRIGFGCAQLGEHGWGQIKREEVQNAVIAALNLGNCLFDTADCYGLGLSEELLGRTLANRRNEAVIATKFGVRIGDDGKTYYDNSTDWIDQALDASLDRLKTDYIDLYQVHYRDEKIPLLDTLHYLEKKRTEGKIRCYGVTNMNPMKNIGTNPPPGYVSFSNEYSLANRSLETEILENADSLTFISHGSLGQGVLTGKYSDVGILKHNDRRRRQNYGNFHGPGLERNLNLVSAMIGLLPHYSGATLSQMACRWILDSVANSIVLVGIKSKSQWHDVASSMNWRLSVEDLKILDAASVSTTTNLWKVDQREDG